MKAFSVVALCVFGIGFSLFVAITGVFAALPPGSVLEGVFGFLLNGVFYGFVFWLIYALYTVYLKPEPSAGFKSVPLKGVEVPIVSEEKTVPEVEAEDSGVSVIDVEGIGSVYAKKLNSIGIYTTTDLLEAGATRDGRLEVSEKAEIPSKLVLEWVNLSDLMRIKGVGEEYSDLLEEAGVDTVVELSGRVPENLHAKMVDVNKKQQLVRRTPTLKDVTSWINQAKELPRKIQY